MKYTALFTAALAISGLGFAACASATPVQDQATGQRVYTYLVQLDDHGDVNRYSPYGFTPDGISRELEKEIDDWIFESGGNDGASTTTYLRVVVTPRTDGSAAFDILSATTGPAPERLTQPDFPIRDQRAGHEGTVVMKLEVGANGRVDRAQIHGVNGDVSRSMAKAATNSALQWRFKPEIVDGQAVTSTILMPVCYLSPKSSASQCAWQGPDARQYSSKAVVTLNPASKLVSPLAFEGR